MNKNNYKKMFVFKDRVFIETKKETECVYCNENIAKAKYLLEDMAICTDCIQRISSKELNVVERKEQEIKTSDFVRKLLDTTNLQK